MAKHDYETPRLVQRFARRAEDEGGTVRPGTGGKNFPAVVAGLGEIMDLDYMGSSEFEGGAVGGGLRKMIEGRSKLAALSFVFNDQTMHAIVPRRFAEQTIRFVTEAAQGQGRLSTKEPVRLSDMLALPEGQRDIIGWLDINNGAMFFADEAVFKSVAGVMGVNGNRGLQPDYVQMIEKNTGVKFTPV